MSIWTSAQAVEVWERRVMHVGKTFPFSDSSLVAHHAGKPQTLGTVSFIKQLPQSHSLPILLAFTPRLEYVSWPEMNTPPSGLHHLALLIPLTSNGGSSFTHRKLNCLFGTKEAKCYPNQEQVPLQLCNFQSIT